MATAPEQKLLYEFGKNIARARKARGITQQQLAEQVGMSVVAIAYIETGKRWVKLATMKKLSKALKVDMSSFVRGL